MAFINQIILDNINRYKTYLEQSINTLCIINQNYSQINLFCTGEYKLFSIITENVRMDLNYLLYLNPDFDMLGFPALKRNIRINIEAYYDLFNLTSDRTYLELLKYQSVKGSTLSNLIINQYKPFIKEKRLLSLCKSPLRIAEKANIAIRKNKLNTNIADQFKPISKNSNSYIHPDIFIVDNNRENTLKTLILCDCQLIMYSFELLNNFIKKQAPYISLVNPYNEYNRLYQVIAFTPWIYI